MSLYNYEFKFIFSLLITVIIETITLILIYQLFKNEYKVNIRISKLVFTGFFLSFATLPYLWFILPIFIKDYLLFVLLGEILVTLIESIMIMFITEIKYRFALIVSIICNLSSFLFGLIVNNFIKI